MQAISGASSKAQAIAEQKLLSQKLLLQLSTGTTESRTSMQANSGGSSKTEGSKTEAITEAL
jgi:hypothetical protein